MKVVKLTVHKNTLQKRKDKKLRSDAVKLFKECINQRNIAGYTIAVWDKSGDTTSCMHITKDSPITTALAPEHTKNILLKRFIND